MIFIFDYVTVQTENNYTCESTETGAVTQRSLYRDLFKQNGMDFVTENLL